jgi:hypothetical protein
LARQQREGAEANETHRAEHEEEPPAIEIERTARQEERRQRKRRRQYGRNGCGGNASPVQLLCDSLEVLRRYQARQAGATGSASDPARQGGADQRSRRRDWRKYPEDLAMLGCEKYDYSADSKWHVTHRRRVHHRWGGTTPYPEK